MKKKLNHGLNDFTGQLWIILDNGQPVFGSSTLNCQFAIAEKEPIIND
jgi:hypothetical protein